MKKGVHALYLDTYESYAAAASTDRASDSELKNSDGYALSHEVSNAMCR